MSPQRRVRTPRAFVVHVRPGLGGSSRYDRTQLPRLDTAFRDDLRGSGESTGRSSSGARHHALMGEQDNGRDRAGASDDPAATGAGTASPTGDGVGASLSGSSIRGGGHRGRPGAAVRVRRAVQTIMNLMAVTVRLVACLFAVVLVVRIGLAFVPVNPNNVIVEWIVRVADILVLDFRDLF